MNKRSEYHSEFGYFVTTVLIATPLYALWGVYSDLGVSTPFFILLVSFSGLNFLILRMMINTRYFIVNENTLEIEMGWFDWPSIKIADITSIESTYNPISSPAPSLKRLKIRYGKNHWILISPKERQKFVGELQKINPKIFTDGY